MGGSLEALYAEHRIVLARLALDGETKRPVFGEGPLSALLMLIGEAPGAEETEQGRPFVGRAGKQLDRFLDSIGLMRGELFITNAVKYRPYRQNPATGRKSNRPPTKEELLLGKRLLLEEVRVVAPRVIATLGNSPLFSMLDNPVTIGQAHGRALFLPDGRALFPLYHPASVIYNPSLRAVYSSDLAALKRFLQESGTFSGMKPHTL